MTKPLFISQNGRWAAWVCACQCDYIVKVPVNEDGLKAYAYGHGPTWVAHYPYIEGMGGAPDEPYEKKKAEDVMGDTFIMRGWL